MLRIYNLVYVFILLAGSLRISLESIRNCHAVGRRREKNKKNFKNNAYHIYHIRTFYYIYLCVNL